MRQLFWIKVCSDLLGAAKDREQCWRPVQLATDISINQTVCERYLPVAVDPFHWEVKLLLISEHSGNTLKITLEGEKPFIYMSFVDKHTLDQESSAQKPEHS